jgi:xylulokinase
MYLIGYDIGSSSVKATLISAETGRTMFSAYYPKKEMKIEAEKKGWAEQSPALWWENLCLASREVCERVEKSEIKAVGISYQMHGLVMINKDKEVLRPSIIWCDSRAVHYGDEAFREIGEKVCLSHSLNSPGNFTASKLKWVRENERKVFDQTWKIMLPGDYIAMKMTGEVNTTISGLSEGVLWDFIEGKPSGFLMDYYGFDENIIPEIVPAFSEQGKVKKEAADQLGLPEDIPVAYRAGDQPNNAFSLNVLKPGEIAATAGTSGVVYGVSDEIKYDPHSRVNSFAHVNHSAENNRLGILLCINGTGILYSWLKNNFGADKSYEELNELAAKAPVGSDGITIFPFGNGAERMLNNQDYGARMDGINFNRHDLSHVIRAGQEGIVFSFMYGIEIMKDMGIDPSILRAGNANMFLSPIFRETLASAGNISIELYDTDGSAGAAKAAGVGAGIYSSFEEAFKGLERLRLIEPLAKNEEYIEAYEHWKYKLELLIS